MLHYLTVAAVALALAGGAAWFPAAPTMDAPGAMAEHVHIVNNDFSPQSITVDPGTLVEWDNHDGAWHTVTADDGSWDSGRLDTGQSWSRVFDDPGEYAYHCEPHPWMTATVIVRDPTPPPVPNEPPTVAITSPADGSTVSGVVNVEGTAADADGTVERVDVSVNGGAFLPAAGTTTWNVTVDTTNAPDGVLSVRARAYDGANFSAIAEVRVNVDNPEFPDLVLENVRVTSGLTRTILTATVTNGGNAPAAAFDVDFAYEYEGEWRTIGVVTVPDLAVGAEKTVTVSWDTVGKVGRFNVEARADPAGVVAEWVETNNAQLAQATVLAGVQPVDVTG